MELIDSLSLGEEPVELWYKRGDGGYTWVIEINTDDVCYLVSNQRCPKYRLGDAITLNGTVGVRMNKYGLHPLADVLKELTSISCYNPRQRCDRIFAGVEYNILEIRKYNWYIDAIREILEKITVV